jgi:sortase A
MMGMLSIPAIGVVLPIFHYADGQALDRGVGHLFGSALPVGGESTHAVLTAHSGMVGETLFNDLDELRLGDTFTILVLDEILTYQVNRISVVDPLDVSELERVPGGDFVTLLTCTPIGVNTHRLLVRGERIATPAALSGDGEVLGVSDTGFLWWLFPLPVLVLAAVLLTRPNGASGGASLGSRAAQGKGELDYERVA